MTVPKKRNKIRSMTPADPLRNPLLIGRAVICAKELLAGASRWRSGRQLAANALHRAAANAMQLGSLEHAGAACLFLLLSDGL